MLFAHGTDYKAALQDFVRLSGPTALMDFEVCAREVCVRMCAFVRVCVLRMLEQFSWYADVIPFPIFLKAYGVWYSKYYRPGANESTYREVISEYKSRGLPLNVLVRKLIKQPCLDNRMSNSVIHTFFILVLGSDGSRWSKCSILLRQPGINSFLLTVLTSGSIYSSYQVSKILTIDVTSTRAR